MFKDGKEYDKAICEIGSMHLMNSPKRVTYNYLDILVFAMNTFLTQRKSLESVLKKNRSSHRSWSVTKVVLKNFANFIEKQSLLNL